MDKAQHGKGRRSWLPAHLLVICLLGLAGCSTEKPQQTWEVAVHGLYDAALSADGRYLVAASIQHGGSLWQLPGHERLYSWNHQPDFSLFNAVALSPEGRFAVTAAERSFALWNVDSGRSLGFWTSPDNILDMALSTDGDYALLGLADHSAVYIDAKQGGIKYRLPHDSKVVAVALSADKRLALTGSADGSVKLWKLADGTLQNEWQHGNQISSLALAPDGSLAFSAGQADRAEVRDTRNGTRVFKLQARDSGYLAGVTYTAARFNERQQLLTGTTNQLIQLWNIRQGTELKRWKATKKDAWRPQLATIIAVAFAPGNREYRATASNGLAYRLR